ncbi:lipopolysaccharide core heptose(II) kinase RfaY [Erwinia sp. P6884]|uniref:lipopolysaccharide core heptose(II) kinase RfaY n=1 Tax=Erwinia sp. P6884 TaxID=3141450 RepID=UPI00318EBB68
MRLLPLCFFLTHLVCRLFMLHKNKYNDFTLYFKESQSRYSQVFESFVKYQLPVIKVLRSQNKTKVILTEHDKKLYILKVFKPNGKRVERLYKSFFKKDYFVNLIKRNDVLWAKGMRFQNDVYLLAQRKRRHCTNLYIMLNEYIPGKVLNEFDEVPDGVKQDVKRNMSLLHQHKLVSGDAHKGNFILSREGVRIIDLCGKKFTRRRVAEDRLALENRLHITDFDKDFAYYLLKAKFNIRNKIKTGKNRIVKVFS